jgi:hypothetical protein
MQNITSLSSVKNNVLIESDIIWKHYYQCAETARQARPGQSKGRSKNTTSGRLRCPTLESIKKI